MSGDIPCVHGRRKAVCKECGGVSICEHHRQKANCRDCHGSQVCSHGKIRSRCKECGGVSACVHTSNKKLCKLCDGSLLCLHSKERRYCVDCKGSSICEHKTVRFTCRLCSPLGWAKCIIRHLKNHAVKNGYEAPKITSQEVVELMRVANTCVLCGGLLDWLESHHLHHSHTTGLVEGFAHGFCNLTEGRIMKLSTIERRYFLSRLNEVIGVA